MPVQPHQWKEKTREERRLLAEEVRFPEFDQTATRRRAYSDMIEKIDVLRRHETISLEEKLVAREEALAEYRNVLWYQEQVRLVADVRAGLPFGEGDGVETILNVWPRQRKKPTKVERRRRQAADIEGLEKEMMAQAAFVQVVWW